MPELLTCELHVALALGGLSIFLILLLLFLSFLLFLFLFLFRFLLFLFLFLFLLFLLLFLFHLQPFAPAVDPGRLPFTALAFGLGPLFLLLFLLFLFHLPSRLVLLLHLFDISPQLCCFKRSAPGRPDASQGHKVIRNVVLRILEHQPPGPVGEGHNLDLSRESSPADPARFLVDNLDLPPHGQVKPYAGGDGSVQ